MPSPQAVPALQTHRNSFPLVTPAAFTHIASSRKNAGTSHKFSGFFGRPPLRGLRVLPSSPSSLSTKASDPQGRPVFVLFRIILSSASQPTGDRLPYRRRMTAAARSDTVTLTLLPSSKTFCPCQRSVAVLNGPNFVERRISAPREARARFTTHK